MQTLKALKDATVVGARMRVLDHWIEKYRDTERVVTKVQGNGFFFTMESTGDKRLWSPFPKRSELTFLGDGAFRVDTDDERTWTLRFEN